MYMHTYGSCNIFCTQQIIVEFKSFILLRKLLSVLTYFFPVGTLLSLALFQKKVYNFSLFHFVKWNLNGLSPIM